MLSIYAFKAQFFNIREFEKKKRAVFTFEYTE